MFTNQTDKHGKEIWSGDNNLANAEILKDINSTVKFVDFDGAPVRSWYSVESPTSLGHWTYFISDKPGRAGALMVTGEVGGVEYPVYDVLDSSGNLIYGAEILAIVDRQIIFRVGVRIWATDKPNSSTQINAVVAREVSVSGPDPLIVDYGAFQGWLRFPATYSSGQAYTAFVIQDINKTLWRLNGIGVGSSNGSTPYDSFRATKLTNASPLTNQANLSEAVVVGNAAYFVAPEPNPSGGLRWAIYEVTATSASRLTAVNSKNRPQLSYAANRLWFNVDPSVAGVLTLTAIALNGSIDFSRVDLNGLEILQVTEHLSAFSQLNVALVRGRDNATGATRLYRYASGQLTQVSALEVVSELEPSSYYGGAVIVGRDANGNESLYRYEKSLNSPAYILARISDHYQSALSAEVGRIVAVGSRFFVLQQTTTGVSLGVLEPYSTLSEATNRFPRPVMTLTELGPWTPNALGIAAKFKVLRDGGDREVLAFERISIDEGRELWLTNGFVVVPAVISQTGNGDRSLVSIGLARSNAVSYLYLSYAQTPQRIERVPLLPSFTKPSLLRSAAPGEFINLSSVTQGIISAGLPAQQYILELRDSLGNRRDLRSFSSVPNLRPWENGAYQIPSDTPPGEYTITLQPSYTAASVTRYLSVVEVMKVRVYSAVRIELNMSAAEGSTVTGRVYLNAPHSYDIQVNLKPHAYFAATADPSDYQFLGSPPFIPAGQTQATFSILLKDDDIYEGKSRDYDALYDINYTNGTYTEGRERVFFEVDVNPDPLLGRYSGALPPSGPASITILDNDLPPTLSLSTTYSGRELEEDIGEVPIKFSLSSPAGVDTPVTVNLSGTTTIGTDYQFPAQVIIPKDTQSVIVPLKIINDTFAEGVETIFMNTDAGNGYFATIPDVSKLDFRITKNDTSFISFLTPWAKVRDVTGGSYIYEVKAKLTSKNYGHVIVPVTLAGTAVAGVDYSLIGSSTLVFPAGTYEATLQVRILDLNSNRTLVITAQPPANLELGNYGTQTLDLVDSRNLISFVGDRNIRVFENTQGQVVRINLSNGDHPNLTIPLVFGGDARIGVDFHATASSIFIPAGQTQGQTTISFIDDNILPNPYGTHNRTLSISLGTIPIGYQAGIGTQFFMIQDNDPIVYLPDLSAVRLKEGTAVDVQVALSNITNVDVTVPLITTFGVGAQASEVTVPTSVVIPSGQLSANYRLAAKMDGQADALNIETVFVTLGTPSSGVVQAENWNRSLRKTFSLIDGDSPPKFFWDRDSYSVSEGGTAKLQVELSLPSEIETSVALEYEGGRVNGVPIYSGPSFVTFAPGETVRKISIKTVENSVIDPEYSLVVSLKSSPDVDPNHRVATLTIRDDDAPPPTVPKKVEAQAVQSPPVGIQSTGSLAVNLGTSSEVLTDAELVSLSASAPSQQIVDSINNSTQSAPVKTGTIPLSIAVASGEAGFLAGATFIFDYNKNGVRDLVDLDGNGLIDEDDYLEPVFQTAADGKTLIAIPAAADRDGDNSIDIGEGQWIVEGGIDTSTGLQKPFNFEAPVTFYVASSSSTLINALTASGLTIPSAVKAYFDAFSLPYVSNIETFEFLRAASLGNLDLLRFFQADTELYVTAGLLADALTAAEPSYSTKSVGATVFAALAQSAGNVSNAQIRLDQISYVRGLVSSVAGKLGIVLTADRLQGLSQAIAQVNATIEGVSAATPAGVSQIVRIQKSALTDLSGRLVGLVQGSQNLAQIQSYLQTGFATATAAAVPLNIDPVYLDVQDVQLNEENGEPQSLVFTVTPIGTPRVAYSVDYFTYGVTATAGTDFIHTLGTLNWPAGETTPKTISIPILGDRIFEPTETLKLYFINAQSVALTRNSATATILDTDPELPDLTGSLVSMTPTAPSYGQSVSVAYNVSNIGTQTANAQVRFILSQDEVVDATDAILRDVSFAGLSPGNSTGQQLTSLQLPEYSNPVWSTAAGYGGTFRLLMAIDPLNQVAEGDETNNTIRGPSFNVTYPVPTLAGPTSVTLPENSVIGTTLGSYIGTSFFGGPVTFTLTGNPAFQINGTTGIVSVADPTTLDFETNSVQSMVVHVTDGFAEKTLLVNVRLTNTNDAPILNSAVVKNLVNVTEDFATPSGTLVSAILGTSVTDVDKAPFKGLAVIGVTGTSSGAWQYTLDGTTWLALGSPSLATARLLPSTTTTTKLRFVPN